MAKTCSICEGYKLKWEQAYPSVQPFVMYDWQEHLREVHGVDEGRDREER